MQYWKPKFGNQSYESLVSYSIGTVVLAVEHYELRCGSTMQITNATPQGNSIALQSAVEWHVVVLYPGTAMCSLRGG